MIEKAFRNNVMSVVQIKVWHKYFKDGRESVESDPRSGRPATTERQRMMNVYGLQPTKISDWQYES